MSHPDGEREKEEGRGREKKRRREEGTGIWLSPYFYSIQPPGNGAGLYTFNLLSLLTVSEIDFTDTLPLQQPGP